MFDLGFHHLENEQDVARLDRVAFLNKDLPDVSRNRGHHLFCHFDIPLSSRDARRATNFLQVSSHYLGFLDIDRFEPINVARS